MMTENNKYIIKEFLLAVGVTSGVFVVFGIICLVVINLSTGDKPLKSSFEVVDKYKGCDVVRYSPQNDAKYHYFLDCKK